jgi:hypothetical protein
MAVIAAISVDLSVVWLSRTIFLVSARYAFLEHLVREVGGRAGLVHDLVDDLRREGRAVAGRNGAAPGTVQIHRWTRGRSGPLRSGEDADRNERDGNQADRIGSPLSHGRITFLVTTFPH